ncbi:glycoside hydrolase family 3 C-terminal domain-containing protein [Novosphingobium resinovorum]|uniref:glycoside hydrolase family 3 C-terminal domain-containing protein n=1 Tax=Novosphingobium resinovorum TaxID=158500 RepID=UPI002ED58441|nr:glycoside hydrolase family 3 C-terminal domain-containing protein [Novosphingobium resinovorum]
MTIASSTTISRRSLLRAGVCSVAFLGTQSAPGKLLAQSGTTPSDLQNRAAMLVAQMTLEEKVALLSGSNLYDTSAIERLGIPSLRMADGPNGVRTKDTSPVTAFPCSTALAATWNPLTVERVARAIGNEAAAKGYQVVFGPAMNIQRLPLNGRNFEYFSEDPWLTGEIAKAWTRGVRSTGRLTAPKHFAANNQERNRKTMSANVSERALREIYLPAFRTVVRESDPGFVMTAYNKVNGVYATDNKWLLTDVLRNEWGFDGAVMSDWGATHSTVEALNAGLDLEMPGPPKERGKKLIAAVAAGKVTESIIDTSARRIVAAALKSDLSRPTGERNPGAIDTPEHRAASRQAATEAIVLLKNEAGTLPIDTTRVRRLALVGPNVDTRLIQGGGSSEVNPLRAVTPLEGLCAALPDHIDLQIVDCADNNPYPAVADPRLFSSTREVRDNGLGTRLIVGSGASAQVAKTYHDPLFMKFEFGSEVTAHPSDTLTLTSEGWFWPPRTGDYDFQLLDFGTSTIWIDGKPVVAPRFTAGPPPMYDFLGWQAREGKVHLEAGRSYSFRLEMLPAHKEVPAYRVGLRMPTASIADAAAAARDADLAVVFVGSSNTAESETLDRDSLDLYGGQNALVEAVVAANPKTVVVLNNGGPLVMPWSDKAAAIVEAWYLGGESGHAIADILVGNANPSGKLAQTFPKRLEDNPTHAFYSNAVDQNYGEGVLVGYRWYDAKSIAPLFPFGHGLSYTSFFYDSLKLQRERASGQWTIRANIRNTGTMAGAEVAQLYISMPSAAGAPPRQLRGFSRVWLEPGDVAEVEFSLDQHSLSYWDELKREWRVATGSYRLEIGSSSRDLRIGREFEPFG